MPRRPALTPSADKRKQLSIYLPEELLTQCLARAASSKRSLNGQLEWLIESGLLMDEQRVLHKDSAPVAAHAE